MWSSDSSSRQSRSARFEEQGEALQHHGATDAVASNGTRYAHPQSELLPTTTTEDHAHHEDAPYGEPATTQQVAQQQDGESAYLQFRSRFLALPAEIRNRIIPLVLPRRSIVVIGNLDSKTPVVFRTCRLLRIDHSAMFYAWRTFMLDARNREDRTYITRLEILRWIARTDLAHLELIRSLLVASYNRHLGHRYEWRLRQERGADLWRTRVAFCRLSRLGRVALDINAVVGYYEQRYPWSSWTFSWRDLRHQIWLIMNDGSREYRLKRKDFVDLLVKWWFPP